jgi:hypothetical protein
MVRVKIVLQVRLNLYVGYQRINEFCFKVRIAPGGACNQSNLLGECSACNPPYVLSRFLCWNITVENCDINQGIVCTKCSPGIFFLIKDSFWIMEFA